MSTDVSIGFDVGGTNLRAVALRGRTPIAKRRAPVGNARDPAAIASRIAELASVMGPADAQVGIGIAAMLRGFDGDVAHSPHLYWRDVPFGDIAREHLAGHEVSVYNDVNAVTYGEYEAGAGRGASHVVGVYVGTGIGGGIVANGRLVTGFANTAAELGHLKVVLGDNARRCHCGLRGCVEAYAGGSYLLERVRSDLGAGVRSLAVELAGDAGDVTVAHIDQAAQRGDDYAVALWEEVGPLLGAALANIATALNPQRIILGGGVLQRTPMLREMAEASCWLLCNPPARAGLHLVDAELGDDAGAIGAALLAQAHWQA